MKIQQISNINYNNFKSEVKLPDKTRNYTVFDENRVNNYVKRGESVLPYLAHVLQEGKSEKEIVEVLYILNRMADCGVKRIDKMYPILAKYNDTKSPNIQTFLAGIYRKIQVPDAFGPLIKMLIQNSIHETNSEFFDPNEEIGGAILSYLC